MYRDRIKIAVREGEVERILMELTDAQETICKCYLQLKDLGVLVFEKEETDSGATDGVGL